jgi:hypothetical protein
MRQLRRHDQYLLNDQGRPGEHRVYAGEVAPSLSGKGISVTFKREETLTADPLSAPYVGDVLYLGEKRFLSFPLCFLLPVLIASFSLLLPLSLHSSTPRHTSNATTPHLTPLRRKRVRRVFSLDKARKVRLHLSPVV